MIIGERLKQCRQQQQLSQETVATKLKVSRQTISNWEKSRSYPDIERCIHLADLYELSLDELLREDQKMVKNLINATNLVKTGRLFTLGLLLNLVLVVGLVFTVQYWWALILVVLLLLNVSWLFVLTIWVI
ncbi:helix-turn-helix domain-containing protein [Loigolactobacillus coryniformis]|uniref:helix-turn-helix domain-containing protein n=1 Tax=Loigolactobacillus coryniformis TaxID=1610 RepID=UPI002340319C|nr:helix-turn-helix transcriptional regulator [Loigolactobacillus coryniformis]MDC4186333.1 helix-turn-helix domain-containing protein [Loigolactobacillus coryniformis]